ncbi:MAG: 6-phosphogluconolactonase [Acidimicrobiales bacterium]|jgi:glucosamine-6-phosphate deaminase
MGELDEPSVTTRYDELTVEVHEDAEHLAAAVSQAAAQVIRRALAARGRAAIVLATGNSQIRFLDRLAGKDVDWAQVCILHMDEYVGLGEDHPASFRRYLTEHIVERVHPRAFYGIQGDARDLAAEMARYRALLERERPDLCVLGIGENGHLAFNDPPADFDTDEVVHEVTLDERCRQQQVGEGFFPNIEAVPPHAVTLTVRALLSPPRVLAVVPERRKAAAVRAALEGPITGQCPASALRTAAHAVLHLDRESASELARPLGHAGSP